MAVHQAADALHLFTGLQPDTARMRRHLHELVGEPGPRPTPGRTTVPADPRTAVATVCLSGALEDKLAAAATAGFDGVEIFEPDLVASPMSPGEVRLRCADLGLSIDLYQPFRDLDSTDDDRLAANHRRAEHKFDVMARPGHRHRAGVLLGRRRRRRGPRPARRASSHGLADRAAERGLRLAYEALAWGRHVDTWEASWDVVRRADHPALGLCLDSFHVLSRGVRPGRDRGRSPARSSSSSSSPTPRCSRWTCCSGAATTGSSPARAAFDLPRFLAAVLAAGYAGPLSLEVFNDVFRQADPGRTAVDAHRSLLALAEATAAGGAGDRPGGRAGAGRRAARRSSRSPPAATGPGPLTDALAALGFARTGQHRTKPVDRWEQGRARVLRQPRPAAPPRRSVRSRSSRPTRRPRPGARRGSGRPRLAPRARSRRGRPRRRRRPRRHRGVLLPARRRRRLERPTSAPPATVRGGRRASPAWTTSGSPSPSTTSTRRPCSTARSSGCSPAAPASSRRRSASCAAAPSPTPPGASGWPSPSRCCAAASGRPASRSRSTSRSPSTTSSPPPAPHGRPGRPCSRIPDNYYDDLAARVDLPPDRLAAYRELGVLHDQGPARCVPPGLHRGPRRADLRRPRAAGRRRRRVRLDRHPGAHGRPPPAAPRASGAHPGLRRLSRVAVGVISRRVDRRKAQKATAAATRVIGVPITIFAIASPPVASMP